MLTLKYSITELPGCTGIIMLASGGDYRPWPHIEIKHAIFQNLVNTQ